MTLDTPKKLTVYYDGDCYVCDHEINLYRKLDKKGQIHFVNIMDPQFDCKSEGLDPKKIHEVFHAKRGSTVFTGVEAFVEIWKEINSLKLLAWLGGWRLFRWKLKLCYWVFIKIRPYLPRKQACPDQTCFK